MNPTTASGEKKKGYPKLQRLVEYLEGLGGQADLAMLRRRVEAIGALGAPVEVLLERLAQAAPENGPVLLDELEEVVAVVDRVTAVVRDALAGAPAGAIAEATATAGAPVADAALATLVKGQVDKALQAAENVVPVIRADALERWGEEIVAAALDAVSATLTTDELRELNRRVAAGEDDTIVAAEWLSRNGLVDQR